MSLEEREQKALARWKPPHDTLYNRGLTAIGVGVSRLIMRGMNSLTIEGGHRFDALLSRGDRGLLTFSNHVSLFDDPFLVSNLRLPGYTEIRWVGADAINFFGSRPMAHVFSRGKCVPIVRGAGLEQPGLDFLRERLLEGGWVHMFPEGGRTREPNGMLGHSPKAGIGRLMAEAHPIALPFYHYGMQDVLPVGAKMPRWRKKVRMVWGEPMDCDLLANELGGTSGPRLWDALTERTYSVLREMEVAIHPLATQAEAVS